MEGGELLTIPCLDRCSRFHQLTTGLEVPTMCSKVEGRVLLVIPCIYCCSCFHEHAADLNVPQLCSDMEGCLLPIIPEIHIRSSHHKSAALLSLATERSLQEFHHLSPQDLLLANSLTSV
jgi:hypothetical protein